MTSQVYCYLLQVFYGSLVTDPTDAFVFAALTEHWVHPGGPKREVGRYHIPSQFFIPGTRLSTLIQAVEGASPPLVFTAEICGLYYTPIVCHYLKHVLWISVVLECRVVIQ